MGVVDMHCDTISRLWELRQREKVERESEGMRQEAGLRENGLHVDLVRMRRSGYLLQSFALFVDKEACTDPWERVCELYELYREEMDKNSDLIAPVYRYADIAANEESGRMSGLLTVEEGAVCRGELKKLKELYDMGVRMLTLTWNYPNELGYPNIDLHRLHDSRGSNREPDDLPEFFFRGDTKRGLTKRGIAFLEEMETLGMIVDVSHLSDAGFYQVCEHTQKPFVASHSNARSVCGWARNLTDDMLGKLGDRGGVVGLNFCKDFLRETPSGQQNVGMLEDVVRHARYITDLGGIELLGLGSDFDGIETNEALPGAESMEPLWRALKKSGYAESELDKIFGGNVLRVFREIMT